MSEINREVREIWNRNAAFWDEKMGEGNDFHKKLIEPAQERLLALRPDELVLDIACGNGLFARRMAQLGARVVAFDFSENLIQKARSRTRDLTQKIEYRVIDATAVEQLASLGKHRFDAAVCTMVFMDMADLTPLLNTLPSLLKEDARFVFSLCHPCFNSGPVKLSLEEEDRGGNLIRTFAVKVSSYILPAIQKGLAMLGQPDPHYYFHRPLSMLFNACFAAGFVLDALEEPVLGEHADEEKLFDGVFKEIPPALVARLRLAS